MAAILPRFIYDDDDAWNNWIRWVVLVVVLVGFFLLFFLLSWLTARRRRKLGRQPYYGTGWMIRTNQPSQQPYYNSQYSQPAPPYSPPAQNNSYYGNNNNYNQGYYGTPYGNQESGIQSPQPVYNRAGDSEYAPPPGPPPAKEGDGVIR